MTIKENLQLKPYNTFGISAITHKFAEYATEEELLELLSQLDETDKPLFHIGGGSNILFTQDYPGTILHNAIKGIEVIDSDDETIVVRVGGGTVWDDFVQTAVENNWYGIENLSLIPGEVGASAVQNIGAYGVEACDTIALVEAIDLSNGSKRIFANGECDYSYRHSIFKSQHKNQFAITYVTFRLSRTFTPRIEYGNIGKALPADIPVTAELMRQTIINIRKEKLPDPKKQGNGGSFFMNPVISQEQFTAIQALYPNAPYYPAGNGIKVPAGWLIEQCGWKGKALGKAAVHDRQALVLVNRGDAMGNDILMLCEAIQKDVAEKFNIHLSPEVNFL